MSILQFIWVGDLDESKTQRLQNPQALSYNKGHPKKMIVRQDKKETRIGRKNSKIPPDYALESAVSNRMISRNHVTIERLSKGNYMLYDHSLNGTYVNFVRVIGGTILKHEDVVCFGHINGANIKPGESVTPFATDLKYRVEIIDKISGDKSATGGASIITRKPDNNNYSQSESDQYDEAASSELNRKSKSNKHKSLINNEKSKKIKLMKQESDDSDRSSDSSDASNNNTNNNNTNINPNNYNRKPKKHADLSSLSSSDDDRLKSNPKNSKDRQFSSKKPPPIGAAIDINIKSSSKHSSSLSDARYHDLSSRKRKSITSSNIESKIGLKKSHESKKLSKSIDDDCGGSNNNSNNRRLYSSTTGGMKDRKMHLNQKSHSKPKYSDNSNNNTSNNGNNNNSSNNNSSNKSMKRNVNNLNSNNYDYEECSAHPCLRPDGDNLIDWIMCDKCAQWFHQSCVGLDEAIEDDENYYCPYCVG